MQALGSALPPSQLPEKGHTLRWAEQMTEALAHRMNQGCFAYEWIERYIRTGVERGIEKFGIVDHLYRFQEFRPYYEKHMILDDSPVGRKQSYWLDRVCVYSIESYLSAVKKAQENGLPLALGIEADFFPGGEEELRDLLKACEFDYIIGSVHFLDGWGFDNPELKDLFLEKDLEQLYRKCFDLVIQAAESGLFDIIAHLDNLKVFGFRPDETSLIPMYRDVAAALKRSGVATEINTGLAYRYPVKEMCPSRTFLSVLFEHQVPVTLSSDAHFPDDIGTMLDDALEMAKQVGYKEIAVFSKRRRYSLPV